MEKYKLFQNTKIWEAYRRQRNLTTSIRKSSIKSYFQERTSNGPTNQHFWSTVKPFISNKSSKNTQELMVEHNNEILMEPTQVSNVRMLFM